MVGILAYIYQEQVHTELELNLNSTFLETYQLDPEKTNAIDFLQENVLNLLFLYSYLSSLYNLLLYYFQQIHHTWYKSSTQLWNYIIQQFKCCGAVSFTDWKFSRWKVEDPMITNLVPDSCCKTITYQCGIRDHPSNINYGVGFFFQIIILIELIEFKALIRIFQWLWLYSIS